MRVGASKNRPKSKQKVRKNSKLTKILKKNIPVTPVCEKSGFLVDFGVPRGTPKSLKIYDPFGA